MLKRLIALLLMMMVLFALTACTAAAEEPEVFTSGDYQYIVLPDSTAEITAYSGEDATLAIPDTLGGKTVTRIGDRAFRNCRSLTAVTIPDSITALGNSAFYFCPLLTGITLPDSVISVGAPPFYLCGSLTRITVSPGNPALTDMDGVLFSKADNRLICCPSDYPAEDYAIPRGTAVIGDGAFKNCFRLARVTIPDSVSSIGSGAFAVCESLTEITIPDSVASVSANPFFMCSSLTDILVSPQHPTLAVIDGVLFTKDDKRLVCYPFALAKKSYEIPDGCTAIGDMAFYRCGALSAVTIPDGVTAIGDKAFYRCEALSAVTVPDGVTAIGDDAFFWCVSLTALTLPDSVTRIGDDAFYGCPNLTLTVTRGSWAAQYCRDNGLRYVCSDGR